MVKTQTVPLPFFRAFCSYNSIVCTIKNFWRVNREVLFLHSVKKTEKPARAGFFSDLVAQLVEHNTFNVGVLGSSPSGITYNTLKGLPNMAFSVF